MCGDVETLDAHLYAMRQLIGLLPLLVTAVSGSGGEEFEYVGFSATIQPTTESHRGSSFLTMFRFGL